MSTTSRSFVLRAALVTALAPTLLAWPGGGPAAAQAQTAAKRAMTFLDVQQMSKTLPGPEPRPQLDALHAHHAGLEGGPAPDGHLPGVAAARGRLDPADDLHEGQERDDAAVVADGTSFVFASNREAPATRHSEPAVPHAPRRRRGAPDHGRQGRRLDLRVQPRWKWLGYRAGKAGEEQLYRLPRRGDRRGEAEQITKQAAGVGEWSGRRTARRIYFVGADKPKP